MKHHRITGAGNTSLHVVETGATTGRPILFIHGLSQCWLQWTRQLHSNLAEDFRLVAVDLRGHGLSEKPDDAYGDARLWADDLRSVIQGLKLDRPILCGWSYGPLVMLDYLRHYGEDDIGGMQFVGGVTKLGSEAAASVLTPEFLNLVPGFFSNDVNESVRSLGGLLRLCFSEQPQAQDYFLMLGWSLSVPPHVRQGLLARSIDNEDLLPKLRKPVLITHGAADAVVKPDVIDQQMRRISTARIDLMSTGHGCFWDDAERYNRQLREFASSL
ncbi:MAG TPA: alpha/beta hydrolase [Steroidobacteraceae bacterium]